MCLLVRNMGPWKIDKEVIIESEVESEAESTEGDEAKLQEGHNQEAKEVIDSKAQCVADLKKKEQIPTVVVYRHPHHIEKQKSSRQGHDASTHLCTSRAPERKPIKRCMEELPTLWEELKTSRNNPMETKQHDAEKDQGWQR